ncbi:Asp-tRNA(Asn)/Glu-tRNA(Gln) amidotransferase GatCAB subunit A [Helicobacter monodelphidis]|uniref:Asp-tRNA(Asn)/Glu-tRNA(Gln) amidotransferase subunit GatA n=1 Tax=Helicobacter sp. 15-1451 TaxID=2004995 RepID=UPI000DCD3405|nr:Asp-tRNA(Asn)/Glu-tRNA(Gln) amidotransferase subunit GatA [Helicobacter sp. 15-1451]RAX57616.1 Asp-tRNA(Asn)/Glu-tRNA(Gln) amidotransferase GatCAB subunit A [Helicobacter sp. 15-1451]
MITLQEALKKDKNELQEICADIRKKVAASDLNAYVGELTQKEEQGIPILVKDNINIKDEPLTCASRILKGYIAPYDATAIINLRKHGCIPFGRANMDEFAMGSTTESSCYGKTLNPVAKNRVPGGSSGGSAAAVAGGIAIAALGSDTGGSIRQPASFCGCVGLKPTYGRISRYGLVAYASSLDQIGPITQNVSDAAILLDMLSGYDTKDSTSANLPPTECFKNINPNRKQTIAVLPDFLKDASQEIQQAYTETISILEKQGHRIIEKTMLDTAYHISAYYIICTAEASANLSRFDGIRYGNRIDSDDLKELYIQTRTQGFGEEVKRRILLGSFVLSSGYYDAYYLKAQQVRSLIKQQFNSIFSDTDLILSPISPTLPPMFGATSSPLEMYLGDIYTISVNLAGLPAISLPTSQKEGIPVGMQLIGKAFDEQSVLDGALSLENALK